MATHSASASGPRDRTPPTSQLTVTTGSLIVEPAWMTKLARAGEHIAALRDEQQAMRDRGELSIAVERDGAHHVLRAVVADPMPPRLSAVIGDALHNARSALDLFASALWPHRVGRALTDREEALIHFPITQDPAEFNRWFERRPALPTLDDQAMADLRWVQPWYYDQQAATVLAREPEWPERRYHLLLRLQDLSNADKHRRLAVVAVFPDMIAAGTPADADVRYRPGTQRPGNGVEIGRWIPPSDNPDIPIEHMGDLCLVLESDLDQALTDPVVEALGGSRGSAGRASTGTIAR